MLILKPEVHHTIWGGDALKEMYPKEEKIGHLYSCVPCGEFDSKIIFPLEMEGKTLSSFLEENPCYKDFFTYVVAIVTPKLDLSIQVHPSHGEKNAKNESWIFLSPPSQGFIYGGCNVSNKEKISKSIAEGTIMELVKKIPINQGDYVFVEGGTLHALTAGSIVYEIEELGGTTCRIYDYCRIDSNGVPRPLQVEEGIRYLDTEKIVHVEKVADNEFKKEKKYISQYYSTGGTYYNSSASPICLTVLGEVSIEGINLKYGTSLILFANEHIDTQDCAFVVVQATS